MSEARLRRDFVVTTAQRAYEAMEAVAYRGHDPYDVLTSPLFRYGPLRTNHTVRFGSQQLWRRLPIDFRWLLRIERGYNPVTIAFALQGQAELAAAEVGDPADHRARADFLIGELLHMRSLGWTGDSWGYDFDWESRYARMPAGTPTAVATGFVSNALFTAYELLGDLGALASCRRAASFVMESLNRTSFPDGTFCWSYSPMDTNTVLNSTMKCARLLAQLYSVSRDPRLLETARATVAFVAAQQRESGAWPYSVGDARGWADHFHTGYILDCLHEYQKRTRDLSFNEALQKGWLYYRTEFFDGNRPRLYDTRTHPIDANSCAQAILTLCRFGDVEQAFKVAAWAVSNLQRADGAFCYQRTRLYTNRISYIRWSTSPMFAALSRLASVMPADD